MKKRSKKSDSAPKNSLKAKLRKKLPVIIACLVAAVAVMYGSYSLKVQSVHKVVVKTSGALVSSMEAGDAKAAYSQTSTDFQATMNLRDFTTVTSQVKKYTDKTTRSEQNWAFKTDTDKQQYAQVNYKFEGGKKPYYMRTILQKEGNTWRVVMINFGETAYPKTMPKIE